MQRKVMLILFKAMISMLISVWINQNIINVCQFA